MYVRTHIPSSPLNTYVTFFTYYKNYAPDYSASKMLPDGSVELIILLDDIQRVFYKEKHQPLTFRKTVLCGMQQEFVYTAATGYSVFSIKFKAGGSYPFLHLPLLELKDLFVDAEQVLGRSVLWLREQLLALNEPHAMFRLVETFLMERLAHSQQQRLIDHAVSRIRNSSAAIRLRDIAAELGYSQKQFIHIFKQHVGLGPKTYQRIARFNKVLQKIDEQPPLNWSHIGPACGFYDQAHLINDFKFFSGIGPQDYVTQKGEYPHFIPIY